MAGETETKRKMDAAILDIITELQAGRAEQGLKKAGALVKSYPDETEPQMVLALCERRAGKGAAAIKTLETLLERVPTHGRAWQELGHCRRAIGSPDAAAYAYRKAVDANDYLVGSWQAIAAYEAWIGNQLGARMAGQEVSYLQGLPQQLVAIGNLLNDRRFEEAEALCREFLETHPDSAEAKRLLAKMGVEFGRMEDAARLLEQAVQDEPKNVRCGIDFVNLLSKLHRYEEAYNAAQALAKHHPGHPNIEILIASQAAHLGRPEEAVRIYDALLPKLQAPTQLLNFRALALNTQGDQDGAVSSYRRAIASNPASGAAWWGLANLKTFRFPPEDITAMERQLSGELQDGDRTEIEFALGKALEDEKRFEASFKHYQAGNQLASKRFRFDDEATRRNFEAVKDVFTEDFYRSRTEFGDADPAPIFIVGLQRSGSTLLEQILSAHSQVDGTQELKFVTALIRNLKNTIGPDEDDAYRKSMEAIDADTAERLGQTYLKQLAPYRKSGRFFTDKLPDNFKHVGFIKMILPHAKIIDARRHPMACGFSCFKQLFSSGAEFSYSLEDMGTYYRLYDDLMSHFNEVLPGQILRVNNEDVIEDLEGEVRRILDFLGLEFEEACLNYHKQDRAVFTPSASQVRKPISRSGMEQWKNFDPWLGPLREALGDLL